MISLLLLLLFACASPDETYTTAPGLYADVPARELLAEWMAWRDISRSELERRMTVQASNVRPAVGNLGEQGVQLIDVPSYCPALFFVDGDQIVRIHIASHDSLAKFKASELEAWFPPEANLRSRAGKTSRSYVNASAGIAWDTKRETEKIVALEIFQPTTVETYKARFYEDPGVFVR
ncbi:hypothetical protein L6R49_26780 [Myxococcota bacterium]|nr:hypothetical protein [Myxococcota bacterium]